jgi:hypothetical protein
MYRADRMRDAIYCRLPRAAAETLWALALHPPHTHGRPATDAAKCSKVRKRECSKKKMRISTSV